MPRKPRNSPNPPGRRPKVAQVAIAVARLESGAAATIAEAVEGLDVGRSTAARHLAASGIVVSARAPSKLPAPLPAVPAPPVAATPAPAPPAAPVVEAAPAPPAPPPPPTIALGQPMERARVYCAHDADVLAMLDRLDTPLVLSTDPRENAQRLLANLERDYRLAGAAKRGAIAEKIVGALRELRQYFPPAKPPPPQDHVLAAIRAQDFGAIAKIEEHLALAEQATAAAITMNGAPNA